MSRKKSSRYIVTLLGEKQELEYLGKGSFMTAWRKPGTDIVYLVGNDVARDCIALWGQDPENGHIPVLERVGYNDESGEKLVYETRYYSPLKAAHKPAWAEYRALQELLEKARTTIHRKHGRSFSYARHGYDVCQETINLVAADSRVSPLTVSALQTMLDAASNSGAGVMMEFAARNLGVDKTGQLVLMDVFFNFSTLW